MSHQLLPKSQRRLLIQLRSDRIDDNEDTDGSDDISFIVAYKRPKVLNPLVEENDEVSKYVQLRLQLARESALTKYREKWG